jgi:hypothetical protein
MGQAVESQPLKKFRSVGERRRISSKQQQQQHIAAAARMLISFFAATEAEKSRNPECLQN